MGAPGLRFLETEPPARGAAREIAEGVLWMRLPVPFGLDHVNIYALDDGDGWTVVDTGLDTAGTRAAWAALLDGPLAGKPVRRVILTHHHPDHVGLAGWFREEGAEIVATRTAWLYARMLRLDTQEQPPEETLRFWRRAGMDAAVLEERTGARPFNFADCVAEIPLGYTRIGEGDAIGAGGRAWQVRTGDGHAPEHATLWSGGIVLGGDQFLPAISPNLSVYPAEPEADPVLEWTESCRRFATMADNEALVLPGHGRPYRGLARRLGQLLENHESALARLGARLEEGEVRAGDCFGVLFGREIGAGEYGLALGEALAHLNRLWHAGKAERREGDDGAWWFGAR